MTSQITWLYLGSNLSKERETGEDIQARIGKARKVFAMLW